MPADRVWMYRPLCGPVLHAVSQRDGRHAGAHQAAAGTADAIDATMVLLAAPGDRILTSDPKDMTLLAAAADNGAVIIAC